MYPNRHKGKRTTHDVWEQNLPRHTEGNLTQGRRSELERIVRQSICQYKQGPDKTSIARCQLCGVSTSCALTFLCCTTNMQSRSRCCAWRIPLAQALNLHCSGKCLVTGNRRGAWFMTLTSASKVRLLWMDRPQTRDSPVRSVDAHANVSARPNK